MDIKPALSTHKKVHVLENGKFLQSKTLISPMGEEIDANLLRIREVQQLTMS